MMWGYGGNYGWIWVLGLLLIAGLALLVVLTVRVFSGGGNAGRPPGYGTPGSGGTPGRSRAREILDERFATGELTAEQYREQLRVLDENR